MDRPIGAWLLFWPCVFGLALGAAAGDRPFNTLRDCWLLMLFGVGSVVMRGAGCTYNDIVDRDLDAQVARTRGRPLPSGAVSVKAAWLFLGGAMRSRARHSSSVEPLFDRFGRSVTASDCGISLYETHHLVAAGMAWVHV
ncbi:MAG: UbiA family prenyltransferase [Rhizomicrobium sp.]